MKLSYWSSLATVASGLACSSGTNKAPPPPKHEAPYDAGPPPTVTFDASAPIASPAYLAAKARAKAFAADFRWSEAPSLDQAPKQPGSFGGVGAEAFAIEKVEIWIKKGEFSLRAATGGVERCLGPEIIVRGALEQKSYSNPFDSGRGYFQAPRGGDETDQVSFVETTSYQAKSAAVIEIEKLVRGADGEPKRASGRFVTTMEARSPFKPMWAAGRFVDAPVTVFAP